MITRARGRIAKKTFIRAKAYPSVPFDASLAKFKADAAWKTHEMAGGHDAMMDLPDQLAGLIDGAA